jgi:phosphoglycolate phosphatase-like HAD superfamily hydrolase
MYETEIELLKELTVDGSALEFANESLRNKRHIILYAVSRYGCALAFASESLRSDREIVLTAVRQDGIALAFASQNLRADYTVVLEAIQQCNDAIEYASEDIKRTLNKNLKGTKHMNNIIGLVFDFDITLAPEFQQQILFDKWEVTAEQFWGECAALGKCGYDMEHAYMRNLIDYGRRDSKYAIGNATLNALGKQIDLYEGLSRKNDLRSIFDDLHALLQKKEFAEHNIELECYCISGGIKPMIEGAFEAHNLNTYFKEIFACDFDEDDEGKLGYIKETVGHTIKNQKLFMIAKGVSPKQGDHPSLVNEVTHSYRIPFNNMIFLGDGQTDIPAFSLVNKNGGKSIAVYHEEKNADGSIDEERTLKTYLNGYKLAVEANRAEQLLPADYSSGKPLKMALLGYVESIAKQIASNAQIPHKIK